MKISYDWLKDFLDIDFTAKELAQKLVSLGIEVSSVYKAGADFSGVVTAEIKKIEKHPNADKLSLVEVNYGEKTTTVVCGATNISQGQKVPLALVGAKLSGGILKKAKIRGIFSEGMLCSATELNLEGSPDGILILDENTPIGEDFALMQGSDTVLELEITPNRGDLLSHYGIARELAVSLDIPSKIPKPETFKETGECIPVKITDTQGCKRYFARVIKNVTIKESPQWLKKRLKAIGVNPKNGVVDITNYVLHELGQPLHAFDLDKVEGKINVRRAKKESFISLDGEKLDLNEKCLVIADDKKPLALAGVIGGADCAVSQNTRNILLESAYFSPPAINTTAREFNLRTDASYRFERGCDIEIAKLASDRATALILEICTGNSTKALDVYHEPFKSDKINFDPDFINKLLGTKISRENIASILSSLDAKLETKGNLWTFHTQSHRHDLKTKWDLAEEVARFYGYSEIPDEIIPVIIPFSKEDEFSAVLGDLQKKLAGLGFYEVKNYDFLSEKDIKIWALKNSILLKNPISTDLSFLKTSLFPGIMKSFLFNESRNTQVPWLFEISRVYFPSRNKPVENTRCSAVLSGKIPFRNFWGCQKSEELNFYHLKGIVTTLLAGFEIKFTGEKNPPHFLRPDLSAGIDYGGKNIGFMGKLDKKILQILGVKTKNIWVFDFSMSEFRNKPPIEIKRISKYPASWRDLSLVADKSLGCQTILNAIEKINNEKLLSAELIDIYEGEKLPSNKKSMTFRLIFSDPAKTLTDKEIDSFINDTLAGLKQKLKIDLRK